MSVAEAPERSAIAWIDCLGTTRAVEGGSVRCPVETDAVPVETCLDCRHLSAAADERAPDRDCHLPDRMG